MPNDMGAARRTKPPWRSCFGSGEILGSFTLGKDVCGAADELASGVGQSEAASRSDDQPCSQALSQSC